MDLCEEKELFFFLQDCAMANNLELIHLQKSTAPISALSGVEGSVKVYRDDEHKKYSNLIAQAGNNDIVPGNPAASGYTVIAIVYPNIQLRNSLGPSNLDATASTQNPLTEEELNELAASVPQPPTEARKPKKKKTVKKNKKAHQQAVEPAETPADDQSPEQDDEPLADALLTEIESEPKEAETEALKVTKESKFSPKQIVKSSDLASGKSFALHGVGSAAKDGNGESGWETVKPRLPNKHRGASAQVHHRPGISQTYAPRTPSLQVSSGSPSSQPPFRVLAPQHIPRGPAAQFHHQGQRAMASGERRNQVGAVSLQVSYFPRTFFIY